VASSSKQRGKKEIELAGMINPFDHLCEADKLEVLKKAGMPILVITHERYCVTLYVLEDFLVERYYNCHTKAMEAIRTAETVDLEKYLDEITINEIYRLI
jgi:hypothetical protein